MSAWKPGSYLIATARGRVETQIGFVYRNLGMTQLISGSPNGLWPPMWGLTHQGSGHRICNIIAQMSEAFGIATEIADCGDWDFDGINGYLNRDPDLPKKFHAILEKYPKQLMKTPGDNSSEDAARQIVEARA